jgi:small multidrug resistance pump
MTGWLALSVAVAAEIVATSALNASAGFTKSVPAAVALGGYLIAFYSLSIALRTIPLGLAYAVWSGVGILVLAIVGWLFFKQGLTLRQCAGLALIAIGIALLRLPPVGLPRPPS